MNSEVKTQLVKLLEQDEYALCAAWESQLAQEALLASMNLTGKIFAPLRQFVCDLISTVRNDSTLRLELRRGGEVDWLDYFRGQPISQVRAVEIFLEGERITRHWAQARLLVSDEDMLEVYERLNLAFHRLLCFYVSQYCLHCRSQMAPEPTATSQRMP